MRASDAGGTTVGMGGCLDRERAFWDRVLNQNYALAQEKAREVDAENATLNVRLPKLITSLRDMQLAWIAFRDATCDFELAQWGGGTGGGPALTACLMRETGEQALYLHDTWLSR
mgnify:CR=1 FL=1